MSLILYSGGLSDRRTAKLNAALHEELFRIIGKGAPITYIPSWSDEDAPVYFNEFKRALRPFGGRRFCYFPIDRPFSKSALREALRSPAIYLSGGNTFYFLNQLRKNGLAPLLRKHVRRGGTLLGVSAGSIIMTPTIRMADCVPGEADDNFLGLKNLKALNLVPFECYPHYQASAASRRVLSRLSKNTVAPIYAYPDGSGIIVEDARASFFGKVTAFHAGRAFRV
jgi:dipeptidase E